MQKTIMTAAYVLLVGCGSDSFSSPAPGDAPVNQGQTPSDNANNIPPVSGTAVQGVYVSASVPAGGDGSQRNPFKTLAEGIALAKAQNLPVNACAETYAEALVLVDGVSVFGFYDCKNNWARGTTNATLASPTSPALVAQNITLPTRVAGFDVQAPDFDTKSPADAPASIALSIRDSKNLTFSSVTAHAGKGAPGSDGTPAATNSVAFKAGQAALEQFDPCASSIPAIDKAAFCTNAMFAPRTSANAGGTATCALGDPGGPGGVSGAPRISEGGTIPSNAVMPSVDGQPGGGPSAGAGGTGGGDGKPGGDGEAGTDGANGQWLLTADGFTLGNGTAGGSGHVGSGGGGGGATIAFWGPAGNPLTTQPNPTGFYETASGAGGGAGGCAGQAGTPGTGGGASIAALIIQSDVTFEQSRLESGAGGSAGKGSLGSGGLAGQAALPGIARKTLPPVMTVPIVGAGGKGGDGGRGGVSGHGAPGPSIALAYKGDRPTLTATDLAPGPAGAGQPELDGTATLPAVTGVSEAEHVIP